MSFWVYFWAVFLFGTIEEDYALLEVHIRYIVHSLICSSSLLHYIIITNDKSAWFSSRSSTLLFHVIWSVNVSWMFADQSMCTYISLLKVIKDTLVTRRSKWKSWQRAKCLEANLEANHDENFTNLRNNIKFFRTWSRLTSTYVANIL